MLKKTGYLVSGVLLACSAMLSPAITGSTDSPVTEFAPGLFLRIGIHAPLSEAHKADIANTGFIVGERRVMVVDPGGSMESGRALRKIIENTTDLPIEYVVLTHFHPDHVAGLAAFADIPHIVAHTNYRRAMIQRSQFYLQRFDWLLDGTNTPFLPPNMVVSKGNSLTIDLGKRKVIINAHPVAHTDNDLSLLDVNTRTLWASDLFFAQRTPSLDGSLKGWQSVMADLQKLEPKLVIPGHGMPGSWETVARPQLAYFKHLRQLVRRSIDHGVALSVLVREQENAVVRDWALFSVQHPSNVSKVYSELEWE